MYLEKLNRKIKSEGKKSALKYANRVARFVSDEEKQEFEQIRTDLQYSVAYSNHTHGGTVYAYKEELSDLQYEERSSF